MTITKKPVFSHDSFFKLIFSDPKLAKELLGLIFTKPALKVFNLEDIKFEKDTHKKQLADLVLSFSFKNSIFKNKNYPKRMKLFIILEHKSYYDKGFYEQGLKYHILIRDYSIKQTGRTQLTNLCLFYHGKQHKRWKKSLQEDDFKDCKDFLPKIPFEVKEGMLDFKVKVINTKDSEIRKIIKNKGTKIWGVLKLLDEVWSIKNPSAKKVKIIIKSDFADILKGKKKTEVDNIVAGIVEYLTDATGLKEKEWERAKKELIEEGILKKGGAMNVRQVIKEKGIWEGMQKGRKEGMQKGMQKGRKEGMQKVVLNMLKKKTDISFISEVTGLSAKEVKQLKNGL